MLDDMLYCVSTVDVNIAVVFGMEEKLNPTTVCCLPFSQDFPGMATESIRKGVITCSGE